MVKAAELLEINSEYFSDKNHVYTDQKLIIVLNEFLKVQCVRSESMTTF